MQAVLVWSLRLRVAGALATIVACATPPPTGPSCPGSSFALIGDMPCSEREVLAFNSVIAQIHGDPSVDFVMHAGDIKGGGEPWTVR